MDGSWKKFQRVYEYIIMWAGNKGQIEAILAGAIYHGKISPAMHS